jgi:hypothetical protein
MSYGYLIGSMGKSKNLKIDVSSVARSLHQTWKEIEIKEVSIGTYLLEWEVMVRGSFVHGGLQSDSQTVSIETSDVTVVAEFAVWYRSLIPQEHDLFLYTGPTWQHPIELFPDTSIEQIVEALNRR